MHSLYDDLDNLMDDAEISGTACTQKEIDNGLKAAFDALSHGIEKARDLAEDAYGELLFI